MIEKLLVVSLLLTLSSGASAQGAKPPIAPVTKEPLITLDDRIHKELEGFEGKVWIYAKNLDSGKDYSLRADEPVRTASTIKLPIMAATFNLVEQGKLHWNDECLLTPENKKGGSGVLYQFSDGSKIDLKTAVRLMIVVSDNTATNLVLDKVTCDGVNAYLDSLGLKQTRSLRHVFGGGEAKAWEDPKMKRFGLAVSTPREMVILLERLERGELVSKAASLEMLEVLKGQQY